MRSKICGNSNVTGEHPGEEKNHLVGQQWSNHCLGNGPGKSFVAVAGWISRRPRQAHNAGASTRRRAPTASMTYLRDRKLFSRIASASSSMVDPLVVALRPPAAGKPGSDRTRSLSDTWLAESCGACWSHPLVAARDARAARLQRHPSLAMRGLWYDGAATDALLLATRRRRDRARPMPAHARTRRRLHKCPSVV